MDHAGGIGNPYSMGIANFVSSFGLLNVPDNVKHRAKLLFLDSIGCGLYGARLEWTRKLIAAITKVDQTKSCSLLAGLEKMGPLHAALVNGTQIQGFELDDVHRKGVLHVGAVTLPPLFALAELNPEITGNDFLRAAIVGYEIGPRVGLCMGQEHIGQGWHSGATVGVFSAVAGASNLLKLTAEETLHAIGIAGTQSSGLMADNLVQWSSVCMLVNLLTVACLRRCLQKRALQVSWMSLRRHMVDFVQHFLDRRIVSILNN